MEHPQYSTIWILLSLGVFAVVVSGLKTIGRKSIPDNQIPVMQVG